MKIIVIGAVAAGTSAATKARRNNENAEIVIYEKDNFISYSGCGMPYFLGGEIDDVNSLTPRNSEFFKKKYNIDVKTGYEVLSINKDNKSVTVKNMYTFEILEDKYDKLVIATGALPIKPDIKGIENNNVFFLRSIRDVIKIKDYIKFNTPKNAIIAGTGFIGFEVLENLKKLNINVTFIEISDKITPNLDYDTSKYFESLLNSKGIEVLKQCYIKEINDEKLLLSNGEIVESDMVIFSTGVKPNTQLAQSIDIELGVCNAIKVNNKMQTNIENILKLLVKLYINL